MCNIHNIPRITMSIWVDYNNIKPQTHIPEHGAHLAFSTSYNIASSSISLPKLRRNAQ